jgi:RNA polymerase sigma-32 factor
MQTAPQTASGTQFFLSGLRRFPMLEPESEYRLALRWREHGDTAAAQQLMTSHLRLVAKIAMAYRGYCLSVDDLLSEGSIGLIQAINRFDPAKGVRLSTYARWWIRASIRDYLLRSRSLVRIGTTAQQKRLFFNLGKAQSQVGSSDGDADSDPLRVVARKLGVAEQDVAEMNQRLAGDLSLNAPIDEDGSDSQQQDRLVDQTEDQEERLAERQQAEARKKALDAALGVLDCRERKILEARRLVEPRRRLEELAGEFCISRERVRQIELRAFQKLQRAIRGEVAAGDLQSVAISRHSRRQRSAACSGTARPGRVSARRTIRTTQ